MAWSNNELLPVESVLFRGEIVKIGRFDCPAHHACFPRTAPLMHDLLVLVRRPLWWRRGCGEDRFAEPGAALLHRAGREVERRSVGDSGDRADWFGVRPDVFEETLCANGLTRTQATERPVSVLTAPGLRWRAERLLRGIGQGPVDRLAVEATVVDLLRGVAAEIAGRDTTRVPARAATRGRRRRLADRTRAWLVGRADNSVALSRLTKLTGKASERRTGRRQFKRVQRRRRAL